MFQIAPVPESEFSRFHVQQKRIRARQASASELIATSHVDKLDLCVLANCEMPSADPAEKSTRNILSHAFLDQLRQYVKGGGSLLVYSGDKVKHQDYNKVFGEMYNLLPLPLKGKVHDFGNKTPEFLSRETFDLPAFQKFKTDKSFSDFNRIEIYKAFAVEEPTRKEFKKEESADDGKKDKRSLTDAEKKDEEAKKLADEAKRLEQEKKEENVAVIVRYKNGWPAVISRKIGEGEVIFVTTSAEPGGHAAEEILANRDLQFTWNNWALSRMSIPFAKSMLAHLLTGTSQEHNFVAGKTFTWNARDKADKSYTLYHPRTGRDDKKDDQKYEKPPERLGLPARDDNTGKIVVKANDLYRAGLYRIRAMDASDDGKEEDKDEEIDARSLPLAVVPDLSETANLDTYKNEELTAFLEIDPAPVRYLLAGTGEVRSTGLDRLNREWTLWLLWALLIMAVFEVGLAYWCGRAW